MMGLSVLYFQLFLVYVIIGLQYNPAYFQYLAVAGSCCLVTSMIANKLSIILFMYQYAGHPLLNEASWRSPRTKFFTISTTAQFLVCLAGYILCKYPVYAFYIFPFYLFPMSHIVMMIKKKTKKGFRWYLLAHKVLSAAALDAGYHTLRLPQRLQ